MSESPAHYPAAYVKLRPRAKAVGIGRLLVSHALTVWGVDEDVIETATLVISELLTNAVRASNDPNHTPPGGLSLIAAQARVEGTSLFLDVWDGSTCLPAPRMAADDAEDEFARCAEGGRGLSLVDALCDNRDVHQAEPGSKVVFAELVLGSAPPVDLWGPRVKLPDAVRSAHVDGFGPEHEKADAAMIARVFGGHFKHV